MVDGVSAHPLCVCVPARNESDRLPRLLAALCVQDWRGPIPVVVAVNNSTDDSLAVLRRCQLKWSDRLDICIVEADFEPIAAHAGSARRLAMDTGMRCLNKRDDAILVSTDADARPPENWLRNIAAAVSRGADLVGGRIDIDPEEPLAPNAAMLREAWDRYWSAVRAIEDAVDPVSWDPSPRHGDHSGASLAITVRAYRAAGGVPLIASGEDQGLVAAAVANGARLVHPADVWTFVSPRCDGRATGGMGDAMRALTADAVAGVVPLAPDFAHWRARAEWRRDLRIEPEGASRIACEEPMLPPMPHDMPLPLVR